jgi:hypothetical protein
MTMSGTRSSVVRGARSPCSTVAQHAPDHAMDDVDEVARFYDGARRRRQIEFAGRRPHHFEDMRQSASGRWEMWMDAAQARALHAARREEPAAGGRSEG